MRFRACTRTLPNEDFFWLIKKIGEDECLPLLEMASEVQWQYILDLELWRKDCLDMESTATWIKRLETADCQRFVRWMFSEGESFAFLHFSKQIEVFVLERKDEVRDFPEGFFSLDGVFYIRVIDPAYRE